MQVLMPGHKNLYACMHLDFPWFAFGTHNYCAIVMVVCLLHLNLNVICEEFQETVRTVDRKASQRDGPTRHCFPQNEFRKRELYRRLLICLLQN